MQVWIRFRATVIPTKSKERISAMQNKKHRWDFPPFCFVQSQKWQVDSYSKNDLKVDRSHLGGWPDTACTLQATQKNPGDVVSHIAGIFCFTQNDIMVAILGFPSS